MVMIHETLGAGFHLREQRKTFDLPCCFQRSAGAGDWGICEPCCVSPELSEWVDNETHYLYGLTAQYPRLNREVYEGGEDA